MTTEPTQRAEPDADALGSWAPSTPAPGTEALPIFAASTAAEASRISGTLPADDAAAPADAFRTGASGADEGSGLRRWTSHRASPRTLLVLSALLAIVLALAGYLFTTTRAYQDRTAWTEKQARAIGTELATTRTELEGTTAELEAVRAQLSTAQARITALADEKAQVGDDREAQRQLVDYQSRITEAAATVASALERCVQGQDTLIGYLNNAASYDPAQLVQYGTQVDSLCQSATDANKSLQDELAK